ncbi:protein-export chaperone SecB [Peptoniphilus grossensis]|uniref:protein-export chaperone SecB n=1 Tax=Peptoniphilus grossensis TaxID=1465756 RepID=UPI0002E1AEB8|nr:protein-export chaperone SecB [Peptoniphilus grossensis]
MNNKSHNGIEGKISFDEYRVLEINYKLNSEFDSDESIVISFELGHDYQIYKNGMNVQLGVKVFEDSKNNGYPFEIYVNIEGKFSFEGDVDGEKFLSNAMAILYPYIRAIVSSYTSLANIPPLTLPTINMQKYLEDSKKINN